MATTSTVALTLKVHHSYVTRGGERAEIHYLSADASGMFQLFVGIILKDDSEDNHYTEWFSDGSSVSGFSEFDIVGEWADHHAKRIGYCNHDWAEYIGITTVDEYCKKCGLTREPGIKMEKITDLSKLDF